MALNPSDFLLKFSGTSVILFAEVIECDTSRLGRNSSYSYLTKTLNFSMLHNNYNPSIIGLTQLPLQAGFKTPPAVRRMSVIMEKCVTPV